MISIVMILLLSLFQLAAGTGMLFLTKIQVKLAVFIPLAFLSGVGIFSILPFVLQLLHLPVTVYTVFLIILLCTLLLNLKTRLSIQRLKLLWFQARFVIRPYEVPALIVICFLVFPSAWRCFYYPPFPRDLTSGAEVIAEFTIREKTMINSVFSISLESTNNPFKPPFITSLQVIYKYAGFPFGQVWLTTLFISFLVFLFHVLIMRVHRLVAWVLLICFVAIPEMYAYTFMALFDYSNAIYFTLAIFFLFQYVETQEHPALVLAGLMMGLSTYARPETLILASLFLTVLWWHHIKNWNSFRTIFSSSIAFILPAFLFYVVPILIYNNYYLPVPYKVHDLVNGNLFNPLPFFIRFADMNTDLIFSETGVIYYGYFIFLFLLMLLLDAVLTDHWNNHSKRWLSGIAIVYLGLPFIGFLLPLYDLDHSTKRGLFKILPLMLLYLGGSGVLMDLSARLHKWERG